MIRDVYSGSPIKIFSIRDRRYRSQKAPGGSRIRNTDIISYQHHFSTKIRVMLEIRIEIRIYSGSENGSQAKLKIQLSTTARLTASKE